MTLDYDTWVARAGAAAPESALRPLLRSALDGLCLALCLHRVSEKRRPSGDQPELTIHPGELDRLVTLLLSTRPGKERWLSVTFDDGYEDAARYVQERAASFPGAEFLYFVCPEKTERRAGFRWDLGAPATFDEPCDPRAENLRPELKGLADEKAFRLADLDLLRELRHRPNVALGNHTNTHFKQTHLADPQAEYEYAQSQADFERLFGEQRHFAFPFGTPQHEFHERHVAMLRARGDFLIWTTEPRPYLPSERGPGAVLPRFPIRGNWSYRGIAAWIAARALYFRRRGPRHAYPRAAPGARTAP